MSDLILGFIMGVLASAVIAVPIYWRQRKSQKTDTSEIKNTIENGSRKLSVKNDDIQLTQRQHTEILGELASAQNEELRQIRNIISAQERAPDEMVRRVKGLIEEAVTRNTPLEQKEVSTRKILVSSGATFVYNIKPIKDQIVFKDEVKVTNLKPDGTTEVR